MRKFTEQLFSTKSKKNLGTLVNFKTKTNLKKL